VRKTRAEEAIKKTAEAGKGTIIKTIRIKVVKAIKVVKPRKAPAKRKVAEVEVESKGNNNSNKIKKSKVIYVREETPITKKNKHLAKKLKSEKIKVKVSWKSRSNLGIVVFL
jgi:hypothetical protein